MKMGIHRLEIPEEHTDIIKDLMDKDGTTMLMRVLRRELKERNEEFWKAIRGIFPELKDVEENLHYMHDTNEVYWID